MAKEQSEWAYMMYPDEEDSKEVRVLQEIAHQLRRIADKLE